MHMVVFFNVIFNDVLLQMLNFLHIKIHRIDIISCIEICNTFIAGFFLQKQIDYQFLDVKRIHFFFVFYVRICRGIPVFQNKNYYFP